MNKKDSEYYTEKMVNKNNTWEGKGKNTMNFINNYHTHLNSIADFGHLDLGGFKSLKGGLIK